MPKSRIAQRLGKHLETIHLWIKGIKGFILKILPEGVGLLGFLDKYKQAKKGERRKRQVDPIVKRWVWGIREREYDCCGQKIQYFLVKEYGAHLSVPKIYEILAEKYVIRSKWKKNKQRRPIPQAVMPRQVIQMDTIDTFSKETDILLTPALKRFSGYVNLLQTDGGPEFKTDFKSKAHSFCSRHRIARP